MTGFARLRRLLCRKPSMRRGRRLPPIPNPACRLQRSGLVIPVLPPVSMGAEARDGTRRDGVGHRDGAAYRSAGSPDADHFRRDASGQGRSGTRLAELRRALDVNPNSSVSLMWPAFCEAMSVLGEAARTHAMLSLRLNPWHFRIGVAHLALAMVSFAAREFRGRGALGRVGDRVGAGCAIPVRCDDRLLCTDGRHGARSAGTGDTSQSERLLGAGDGANVAGWPNGRRQAKTRPRRWSPSARRHTGNDAGYRQAIERP